MDILVVDSVGHIFAYQQAHVPTPLRLPSEKMHYMGKQVLAYALLKGKKRSNAFLRHLTDQTLAKAVLTKEGSAKLNGAHLLLKTADTLYEVCVEHGQLSSKVIDKPVAYGTQIELATVLLNNCKWPGDMVIEFIYDSYLSKHYQFQGRPVITRVSTVECEGTVLTEIHQMGSHTGLMHSISEAERHYTLNAIASPSQPELLMACTTPTKEVS